MTMLSNCCANGRARSDVDNAERSGALPADATLP